MFRVDRLADQARLLRIRRAARAQTANGQIDLPGFFGTAEDATRERALARDLVAAFASEPVSRDGDLEQVAEGEAPARMQGMIVDEALMTEISGQLLEQILDLVEKLDVRSRLYASVRERFFARIGMSDPEVASSVDQNRARLPALRDLAILMTEEVLDRAFAGVLSFHDFSRNVSLRAYGKQSIFIEKGRLKRKSNV